MISNIFLFYRHDETLKKEAQEDLNYELYQKDNKDEDLAVVLDSRFQSPLVKKRKSVECVTIDSDSDNDETSENSTENKNKG